MIRVNLLPPEIKKARRLARQRIYLTLGLGAIVLVLLLVNLGLHLQTARLMQEVEGVRQEREAVEVSVGEHQSYVVLDARVREQRALIRRIMGAPPEWVRVMEEMGEYIPEHVWLTDLRLMAGGTDEEGEPVSGEVLMQGYTYEHPDTAQWLNTLEEMSELSGVQCAFSAEQTYGPFLVVQFEVRSELLPGETFEPPEVGGRD